MSYKSWLRKQRKLALAWRTYAWWQQSKRLALERHATKSRVSQLYKIIRAWQSAAADFLCTRTLRNIKASSIAATRVKQQVFHSWSERSAAKCRLRYLHSPSSSHACVIKHPKTQLPSQILSEALTLVSAMPSCRECQIQFRVWDFLKRKRGAFSAWHNVAARGKELQQAYACVAHSCRRRRKFSWLHAWQVGVCSIQGADPT